MERLADRIDDGISAERSLLGVIGVQTPVNVSNLIGPVFNGDVGPRRGGGKGDLRVGDDVRLDVVFRRVLEKSWWLDGLSDENVLVAESGTFLLRKTNS